MPTLHEDQVDVTADDVRRLLAAQLPRFAARRIEPVVEHGTDHALFRLVGEDHEADLVAKMPIRPGNDDQAIVEAEWLPRLAAHVPVDLSVPVAFGRPDDGYPLRWAVYPWLPGQVPTPEQAATAAYGREVGEFVRALQACDATGAGLFGSRGHPLDRPERDEATRRSLEQCADLIDASAALTVWDEARAADAWAGPATWFHGDLLPGNTLVDADGHLTAVLDWGTFGAGDPACELATAWNSLSPHGRAAFRSILQPDDATWARGRGWAVSMAAIAIPYYRETFPAMAQRGIACVQAVLAES